ncbi:MAG: selenocysteine-specific translation elongation factor [Candidatus Acidiferrales bacterium]
MRHVIVGTAGHIDHGKSTLVEALTGTHPDRLEEEKRRGITIDLGFAFLDLERARLGFVDVPGHERFVRNMLAGAGGIDLLLLVIAADESIKPQTREHFDICRLLGISRGIVVLTKSDAVDAGVLDLVRLEAEEFLRGSFLDGAPMLAVSARTGAGMPELKNELARMAELATERDAARWVRLPIDRAFAMKGFGTVVTGTLVSGTLRPEDEVELFPARRRLRVRGIHSGGRATERAVAGQRTAVNLPRIAVEDLDRGMVLASPGRFEATRRLDARVSVLPSARPLKNRGRVHFHQAACEAVAEVVLLEESVLRPGDSALAQLRLDRPVLVFSGDRFVIRQFSPLITIGGGVVLDPRAPRHRARETHWAAWLAALENGSRVDQLAAWAASEKDSITLGQIITRIGWTELEAREAVAALEKAGTLRAVSQQPLSVAATATIASRANGLRALMEEFHRANPLLPGIPREDLRGKLRGLGRETFAVALGDLIAGKSAEIEGDLVRLAGRTVALSPEESKAKEQIERAFEAAGLTAPGVEEVLAKLPVEKPRARKILQILLREKALVKVTEDLIVHPRAIAKLRELLQGQRREHGQRLTIVAFKELTGVTRKYAIPLLEYLDRERLTRRVGDERVIV